MDGCTIPWKIEIKATQDGAPVNADLTGKSLYDNLALVGTYEPGTFTVGEHPVSGSGTPISPDITVIDGKINYSLPDGTTTPTNIFFETKVLDTDY